MIRCLSGIPRRGIVAGLVVLGIVAVVAITAIWRRPAEAPLAERLARGAPRLEPATYYYALYQNDAHVGLARSSVDLVPSGIRISDVVVGRAIVYGDSQTVEATATAYLTRGFALDSFSLALGGDQGPFRLWGKPKTRAAVLLPTTASIAMMLSGKSRVGRTESVWMYNPLSQRVERVTLDMVAESLFTVVDSARFDSAGHAWLPAHRDTVRAWEITTPTGAISAWADWTGRIVAASEPGGLHMLRTAFELARPNQLPQH